MESRKKTSIRYPV